MPPGLMGRFFAAFPFPWRLLRERLNHPMHPKAIRGFSPDRHRISRSKTSFMRSEGRSALWSTVRWLPVFPRPDGAFSGGTWKVRSAQRAEECRSGFGFKQPAQIDRREIIHNIDVIDRENGISSGAARLSKSGPSDTSLLRTIWTSRGQAEESCPSPPAQSCRQNRAYSSSEYRTRILIPRGFRSEKRWPEDLPIERFGLRPFLQRDAGRWRRRPPTEFRPG